MQGGESPLLRSDFRADTGTLPRLRTLCPRVPVLLSTGRTDQTALAMAVAHPGVTLLAKPFGLRELRTHIEAVGVGQSAVPQTL